MVSDGVKAVLWILFVVVVLNGIGGNQSNSGVIMAGGGPVDTNATSPDHNQQPRASGIGQLSLSTHEQQQLESTMTNYFERLPSNRTERQAETVTAATKLCEFDQHYTEAINISEAGDNATEFATSIRRFDYAVQITNEHFNDELDRTATTKIRNSAGEVAKYAPLAASYNQMVEDACGVKESPTNESIESFYKSSLYFGVEYSLIQAGVFYKPAFAGTRYISNTAGLYRIRSLCGNRCYGLAMSEIHWGLRATPIGITNYLNRHNESLDMDVSTSEIDTTAIVEQQGEEYSIDDIRRFANDTMEPASREEIKDEIGETARDARNWTGDQANISDRAERVTIPNGSSFDDGF